MELKGYSGCRLQVIDNNGTSVVRKISKDIPYNNRLEQQCIKQSQFNSSIIKAPKVLKSGYIGNLFYFDMEYIPGKTLAESISTEEFSYITSVFEKVLNYIQSQNNIQTDQSSKIKNKILSLKIDSTYTPYIDYLSSKNFNTLSSYCHGDLTMENIILYKNDVYFIDFLDSFMDSKLMDYAKLLQDLYCFWSWRNISQKPIAECIGLVSILKKYITGEQYTQIVDILVLNLLRILPYCSDDTTKKLINISIHKLCPL